MAVKTKSLKYTLSDLKREINQASTCLIKYRSCISKATNLLKNINSTSNDDNFQDSIDELRLFIEDIPKELKEVARLTVCSKKILYNIGSNSAVVLPAIGDKSTNICSYSDLDVNKWTAYYVYFDKSKYVYNKMNKIQDAVFKNGKIKKDMFIETGSGENIHSDRTNSSIVKMVGGTVLKDDEYREALSKFVCKKDRINQTQPWTVI